MPPRIDRLRAMRDELAGALDEVQWEDRLSRTERVLLARLNAEIARVIGEVPANAP